MESTRYLPTSPSAALLTSTKTPRPQNLTPHPHTNISNHSPIGLVKPTSFLSSLFHLHYSAPELPHRSTLGGSSLYPSPSPPLPAPPPLPCCICLEGKPCLKPPRSAVHKVPIKLPPRDVPHNTLNAGSQQPRNCHKSQSLSCLRSRPCLPTLAVFHPPVFAGGMTIS